MENGWNLFNNTNGGGRGQSGGWEDLGNSRFDTTTTATSSFATATAVKPTSSITHPDAGEVHALMLSHQWNTAHCSSSSSSTYPEDPHLMCFKLGKRQYFEDGNPLGERHVAGFSITKRGKPYYGDAGGNGFVDPSTSAAATVPRCQVEGCGMALVNAKDYHRRHKVCEVHSKAPNVVVLGLEQRFCQQCSRFHAVTEFDDAKRSCRRRLAGHNERRRKSSHDYSGTRNLSQDHKLIAGRFPYLSAPTGRALSLLSPKNDLSSRCSAALRELIAENRAAIVAKQLILDRGWHQNESNPLVHYENQRLPQTNRLDCFDEAGANVTLDLMRTQGSAFGFLSARGKSEEDEECAEMWRSFREAHWQ